MKSSKVYSTVTVDAACMHKYLVEKQMVTPILGTMYHGDNELCFCHHAVHRWLLCLSVMHKELNVMLVVQHLPLSTSFAVMFLFTSRVFI